MNAPIAPEAVQEVVAFSLNGVEIAAAPDETILEAADRIGVPIPRLCYKPGMRPDGNCRACMVEIKGERVLAPACCRKPTAGMDVQSTSARAVLCAIASLAPARTSAAAASRTASSKETRVISRRRAAPRRLKPPRGAAQSTQWQAWGPFTLIRTGA